MRLWAILLSAILLAASAAHAGERITLASTTSTENSGLLDWLLPRFEAAHGIQVRVIAVGTGQALRLGQNGDADLLMTHARDREEGFVAAGWGVQRFPLMYNDFVIVGPDTDPAGIANSGTAARALERIATLEHVFVSRGDDSGTHAKERELWQLAGVKPGPRQAWYREMGAGMGATLNAAAAMQAYTLTDRATWLGFGNRGGMKILVEDDAALFNQYAVIPVNPKRHPHVNARAAMALVSWLLGPEGQAGIAEFRLSGQQVFFPNASPDIQRR